MNIVTPREHVVTVSISFPALVSNTAFSLPYFLISSRIVSRSSPLYFSDERTAVSVSFANTVRTFIKFLVEKVFVVACLSISYVCSHISRTHFPYLDVHNAVCSTVFVQKRYFLFLVFKHSGKLLRDFTFNPHRISGFLQYLFKALRET